ncbi:formyltetrahydrofolate deformylase [Intrasporangium chromatireducens Q5-1]|uniref:Formyltetrahydrofolate deformylase n=1 Tax=Intrasporangium chromatireducens Q5-1 TaxID=584657 RepID=W9GKS2_9MICO|nr:formyltetrahydrofolate deformylase [Intrasporangium chromatireducens]EWT06861.1 formyltetrahydrofolate deformylase [Intrasporangium chromatireducens Q5-1]
MARHIMTLTCDDRPGIVAAVSDALLKVDANIVENQQFSDEDTNLFFMRTVFDAESDDVATVLTAIDSSDAIEHQHLAVRPEDERCRTLILVSKFDHCLLDLLYRWKSGDLPIDIVGVVSNHEDCRALVEYYGLPFTLIPVTADTKRDAETELMKLVEAEDVQLVVLARYMQILSDWLCEQLAGRAINIHHSFLPGFKGAKPYHQAHDRGVKLVGASAHYVTADLDEGPIIEQDVVRVTHAETPSRLVAIGRDVERRVLSNAVRAHAESRIFLSGRRTIVF